MTVPALQTSDGHLKVDFTRLKGGTAPAIAPADRSLSLVASATATQLAEGKDTNFSALSQFPADQRSDVTAAALGLVRDALAFDYNHPAEMRAALTELLTLGGESLAAVNATVQQILESLGRNDLPDEVKSYLKDLNKYIAVFRGKYSPSREKGSDYYDKLSEFTRDIFGKGSGFFQAMIRDAMSLQRQFDQISAKIIEARGVQLQSTAFTDQLYADNVACCDQLIGEVAVLEEVRRLVFEHGAAILFSADDPEAKKKQELRAVIGEMVNMFDIRINEFHQRILVAWATNPQVRNIGLMSRGMAQRLALLVDLTIPVMKLTVAQWALALKAEKAADLVNSIIDVNNAALQEFAGAMGTSFGKVMTILETPSTSVETIFALAESLAKQTEDGIAALAAGEKERARVRGAINVAVASQAMTSDKLASAMLTVVAEAKKPLAIEPAPEREDIAVITPELESKALELQEAQQAA